MNDNNGFTPEEHAEWVNGRIAARLKAVRDRRPAQLRDAGTLNAELAAWADRLIAGQVGNLVIIGTVGVGKTWSVWEMLDRVVGGGWPGSWDIASAADWQDTISLPVDRERLRDWREKGFLALDDVDAMRVNDWALECLTGVIDDRWAHGRPTVLASNSGKFSESFGPRITSRLRDNATVVKMTGPDRRAGR